MYGDRSNSDVQDKNGKRVIFRISLPHRPCREAAVVECDARWEIKEYGQCLGVRFKSSSPKYRRPEKGWQKIPLENIGVDGRMGRA